MVLHVVSDFAVWVARIDPTIGSTPNLSHGRSGRRRFFDGFDRTLPAPLVARLRFIFTTRFSPNPRLSLAQSAPNGVFRQHRAAAFLNHNACFRFASQRFGLPERISEENRPE
jgi:hypothetical protein